MQRGARWLPCDGERLKKRDRGGWGVGGDSTEPGRRGYLPKKNCSRALVLPVPRYFTNRHAPLFSRFATASNSVSRARYCADVLPSKSGVRTP